MGVVAKTVLFSVTFCTSRDVLCLFFSGFYCYVFDGNKESVPKFDKLMGE